jgi:hypothetical protein
MNTQSTDWEEPSWIPGALAAIAWLYGWLITLLSLAWWL